MKDFEIKINLFAHKIDTSIDNFQFTVVIANFYEVFRFLNESHKKITNKVLKFNLIKIMKLLLPLSSFSK